MRWSAFRVAAQSGAAGAKYAARPYGPSNTGTSAATAALPLRLVFGEKRYIDLLAVHTQILQ
jgi:hypothetical protein